MPKFRILALALATALAAAGCGQPMVTGQRPAKVSVRPVQAPADEPEAPPEAEQEGPSFRTAPLAEVPDQIVVAVQAGARAVLSSEPGFKVLNSYDMGLRYQVVQVPKGMTRDEAMGRLSRQPGVRMVAPNRIYSVSTTPNDSMFAQQWGMKSNRANAQAAWGRSVDASQIKVAVLDTGVDYNHPEFAGRVIKGPDLADNDNDPMDEHGHGTHVAGIIGAAGNNNKGIAGVAWNCQIMAVKVLGSKGSGSTDTVLAGVQWAVKNGAKVINLSLGTSDVRIDPVLHMALEYANKNDVLVVAAAGNDGGPVGSPANDSYAIAVSSTSNLWLFEYLSFFSNRGDKIEVAAPGGGIWSTLPTKGGPLGSMYGKLSGTSMAAPLVAGEAALIRAQHPTWKVAEVRNRIRMAVDDKGAKGRDPKFGYGRINIGKALD